MLQRVRAGGCPSARHDLGRLLQTAGDLEGARAQFEQSLAIRRKALPPGHADVAWSLERLAASLEAMGDAETARPLLEESVPIFRQALAERERAFGPRHKDTERLRAGLADVLRRTGRVNEAAL